MALVYHTAGVGGHLVRIGVQDTWSVLSNLGK